MATHLDRLLDCMSRHADGSTHLQGLIGMFLELLVEPEVTTYRVDLHGYPSARKHLWERDRDLVLALLHGETGLDFSHVLSFPYYAACRAAGAFVHTVPTGGLYAERINLVPVTAEEILAAGDTAYMLNAYGDTRPLSRAAWMARVVSTPMSDPMTAFAVADMLAFASGMIASDALPGPNPDDIPMAEALRNPQTREHQTALGVCVAQNRLHVYHELFRDNPLRGLRPGMCVSEPLVEAHAEMVRDDLDARAGPPAHAVERELRESVAHNVALAHCLPTQLLYRTYWEHINSQ